MKYSHTLFLLIFLVFIGENAQAQKLGYFGKRNFISIQAGTRYAGFYQKYGLGEKVLSNSRNSGFLGMGMKLDREFSMSVSRLLNKRCALGLEVEMWQYQFGFNNEFERDYTNAVFDNIAQVKSVFIVFDFNGSKNTNAITGGSCRMALGYGAANVLLDEEERALDESQELYFDPNWEGTSFLTISIGPVYRYPISKSVLFSVSWNHQFNYALENLDASSNNFNESDYKFNRTEMINHVTHRASASFSSIHLGLTYCF